MNPHKSVGEALTRPMAYMACAAFSPSVPEPSADSVTLLVLNSLATSFAVDDIRESVTWIANSPEVWETMKKIRPAKEAA